jgi:hypothetical protein
METNSTRRIAFTTIAAALLFSMSACTTASYHSQKSEASLASENNISQLAANDSLNQCNEQTRLLKHEIALCRSVPLITVPLQ